MKLGAKHKFLIIYFSTMFGLNMVLLLFIVFFSSNGVFDVCEMRPIFSKIRLSAECFQKYSFELAILNNFFL